MNNQEITTYSKERAFKLVELLLECGYICMLSNEENLYVINFIQSFNYETFSPNQDQEANRNCVVFMSRDDFDEKYTELLTDCEELENE